MSSNIAVQVNGLGKAYRIFRAPPDRLKQMLWRGRKKFYEEFWALHPITLSVKKGECVGFLGKNGSGKSTLLQMIAGTLEPTHGNCSVSGRVSALLELGAGFNPEFTGRENVILNGALLGINSDEMEQRLPSILEFSELGDFIDKPVKMYSSGMFVRLAFSVAIHVEPEILLVDEALSVGDAAFQYKCLRRIDELRGKGMSILFVSHDTAQVRKVCDRAIWIDSGNMILQGDAVTVADAYDSYMRERSAMISSNDSNAGTKLPKAEESLRQSSTGGARSVAALRETRLCDRNNSSVNLLAIGGELRLTIEYEVFAESSGLVIGAAIFRNDHLYVSGLNTGLDGVKVDSSIGCHSVTLNIPQLQLLSGDYYFKVGVFDEDGMVRWDFWEGVQQFKVVGPYVAEGVLLPVHTWECAVRE